MIYETGRKFSAKDLTEKGDYEECEFNGIDFEDLLDYKFSDCDFVDCDLSNVKIYRAAFREVVFKNCKMIGINFEDANHFNLSFRFEDCLLSHSSFYQLDIRKTIFRNCKLEEVDFTESNLAFAVFDNSNLRNAIFDRTVLDNADLRKANDFSINPNNNQLKKTKFSKDNLSGLLTGFNIIIE